MSGDKAGSVAYTGNGCPTLRAESPTACVVGIDFYNGATTGKVSKTITSAATDSDHIPCVISYDARGNGDGDTVSPITGDHNGHMSDYTAIVCFSQDAYDKYEETEHGATLRASGGIYGGGSENLVCKPVYCLQGNGIDRADTASCHGKGVKENECYTLNTVDRHAVCYGVSPDNSASCDGVNFNEELSPTLQVHKKLGLCQETAEKQYVVRRLTPLECCRLQGMPDYWMDGVEGSDAAQYKMWGNGMALPNALYIMEGIAQAEANE